MLKSLTAIALYRQGDVEIVQHHMWLRWMTSAEERIVNLERIASLRELAQANPVLDYVERSLKLLDRMQLSFWMKDILEEVLIWSETAKGGTLRERLIWAEEGINLTVHNEGSAQLYMKYADDPKSDRGRVIHLLIQTHGLIGQQIRGEVPAKENEVLMKLYEEGLMTTDELERLLYALNHCIIGAVSAELWNSVKPEVSHLIRQLTHEGETNKLTIRERMKRLRTLSIQQGEDFVAGWGRVEASPQLSARLEGLAQHTFWYVESALQAFSLEEFLKIFCLVTSDPGMEELRHISFEKLMKTLYYDYKGEKRINVYMKRIIENYLAGFTWTEESLLASSPQVPANAANPHLTHRLERLAEQPDTVFFVFDFSPAARKLIEFCIEAEKTPLYEQAVLMLFDLFGLRRDAYDRFHNEETYLQDMNQAGDHKRVILDYITGNTVLDIGPGGGVMLDLIEQELPGRRALGLDIAANVIEALERRKAMEGRQWEVTQGDALRLKEYVKPGSIGTVIFSSILHELYSYIETDGTRFNKATVAEALRSAYEVLENRGRIIIRDGIMTEPVGQKRIIKFLKQGGMRQLQRYAHDFRGRTIVYEELAPDTACLKVNDAMEFLYTYTWGEEAYVHEVQEQFGIFTPSEYERFIYDTLGAGIDIITATHYLQEGYAEALADKVEVFDEQGDPVRLPDSTCLIVIEKRES
ncbi:SAM-dependent methyltransferase [Paenibacillus sp. CAA11]|uniref:class I SAM-dependent methyltransferase n=1 Tax=Paenibacillus sp. CAA11 TaxID=1532905 RepID=UPI000D39636C|nr:class I SAM-dependent methyltransferase [Paenibacillus sp. CAA11]AWB43561.1 SAM-dependent methyltransferase [Paenibacillus sp. CAA11]